MPLRGTWASFFFKWALFELQIQREFLYQGEPVVGAWASVWGSGVSGFWPCGVRVLESAAKSVSYEGLPIGSIVVPFGDYLIGFCI